MRNPFRLTCRLRPRPAARMDSRKRKTSDWGALNCWMAASLERRMQGGEGGCVGYGEQEWEGVRLRQVELLDGRLPAKDIKRGEGRVSWIRLSWEAGSGVGAVGGWMAASMQACGCRLGRLGLLGGLCACVHAHMFGSRWTALHCCRVASNPGPHSEPLDPQHAPCTCLWHVVLKTGCGVQCS